MDVKILEETDTRIRLMVEKSSPSFVNSLRRVLISEVPKLAIDDVEFHLGSIRDEDGKEYESISPLFDEVVAHRLGMLPIPTDLTLFKFKKDCECKGEGCPNCTVMYTLNKKGPCTVYSGDLEPLGDRKYAIKEDLIPIVKLSKRQALLIYATAVLGRGKQHAKWQTVTNCGYRYYPTVELDGDECNNCGLCVNDCPKQIFVNDNGKVKLNKDKVEDCTLCNSCTDVCTQNKNSGKSKIPITIKGDDTKFIFSFETDGSLSAKTTLLEAIDILEKKFSTFRDIVSEIQ
jgi:DNA-directed RNA polymerase subunit D